MNKQDIIWFSFERDAVPQALNGIVDVGLNGPALTFGGPRPRDGDIVIGFGERPNYQQRIVPQLIVINEFSKQDIFSWLSTYSPETFPLSQFARVISEEDWNVFNVKEAPNFPKYGHQDRWASIILGELLAQGENDTELVNIPFSRATACFSTAVARTSLMYPRQNSAFSICIKRLIQIEKDSRFTHRPVSVFELAKIWEVQQRFEFRRDEYPESLELRIQEAIFVVLASEGMSENNIGIQLENYPGLTRNSMEERILAFQKLTVEVARKSGGDVTDSKRNAIIAAAAFLVGRGTSHVFLIRRISKAFPSAILWFGAIAAIAGSKSWDPHWARAVRGIEKHLRSQVQLTDPSLSDLCWHEYDWLSSVFKGDKVFDSLSKNTPNVISVEIVPGASCQMRLAASVGKAVELEKVSENQRESRSVREVELESIVVQFLTLAAKTQELFPSGNASKHEQPSLFQGDALLSSKAPKKKARGGTGFDK